LLEGRGKVLQADRAGGLDEDDIAGLKQAAQHGQQLARVVGGVDGGRGGAGAGGVGEDVGEAVADGDEDVDAESPRS
jgi:hypothetical protein